MGCKYVKEFTFGGSVAEGSKFVKGYYRGGKVAGEGGAPTKAVREKATGERYPSRKAMVKHEMAETPRMQREELVQKASVKAPAARRRMPVAPMSPLLAMKSGGMAKMRKC